MTYNQKGTTVGFNIKMSQGEKKKQHYNQKSYEEHSMKITP